jgi:hypothetical protein
VGFSLLGHLDLDLELDEELAHFIPSGESEDVPEAVRQLATTFVTPSRAPVTLDPKQPLFFPLPTSFSSAPGLSSTKVRQRDILDVGKDNGWNAYFYRTKTDDEIRAKWEKEKVDLTREWNRRWREAALMATSAISWFEFTSNIIPVLNLATLQLVPCVCKKNPEYPWFPELKRPFERRSHRIIQVMLVNKVLSGSVGRGRLFNHRPARRKLRKWSEPRGARRISERTTAEYMDAISIVQQCEVPQILL